MPRFLRYALFALICSCSSPPPETKATADGPYCDHPQRTGTLRSEVPEASGVAISRRNPGILWVHNDDRDNSIFAVDSTGALKGRVLVPGVRNIDWEDIAVAPCGSTTCVFIGDIGDNKYRRTDRSVIRVTEPLSTDSIAADVTRFPFHMPGKSDDAEALFVTPAGKMYIVSKGRGGPVTVFEFPDPLQPDVDVMLTPVFQLTEGLVQLPDMVTGAGMSPNGKFIAIRRYEWLQIYRLENDSLVTVLPQPFDLRPLHESQGEGVDIRDDGTLFFVSEKGFGKRPPISRLECHLPA